MGIARDTYSTQTKVIVAGFDQFAMRCCSQNAKLNRFFLSPIRIANPSRALLAWSEGDSVSYYCALVDLARVILAYALLLYRTVV